MINLNANISSTTPKLNPAAVGIGKVGNTDANNAAFSKTIKAAGEYLSKVDDLQQSSDMSIKDMLTGKNPDITSVVSAVAKADMSFKLLVGVRNKLIEAYKQTMNMQL
ncbi:MAG: flagellar hook-basal body complex protein FliE [Sedimentisphaerales bacterium]|nr:flagellar hook-basal body complex protein FliE [Sedimentisphaerales bacterium]